MLLLLEESRLFKEKGLEEFNDIYFLEQNLNNKILNTIGKESNLDIERIEKILFENRYNKSINLKKIINMYILPKFNLIEEYKNYSKRELFQLKKISPSFFEKLRVEYLSYKKMSKNLEKKIYIKYSIIDKVIVNYYMNFEKNIDFFIFKNSHKGYSVETLKNMHLKREKEIYEMNLIRRQLSYQYKKSTDDTNKRLQIREENRIQRLREKFIKLDNIFSGRVFYLTNDKMRKEFEEIRAELSSIGRLPY